MAIPDFHSLMLPVLEISARGETMVRDSVPEIARRFSLTEEDVQELLPSGTQTRLMNRLHWAKVHLERAGLVTTIQRGVFTITDLGRNVLNERHERIDKTFLEHFESYREWLEKPSGKQGQPDSE